MILLHGASSAPRMGHDAPKGLAHETPWNIGSRSRWSSLTAVCTPFFGVVHFTSLSMAGFLRVMLTTLFGTVCVWLSSIKTRSLWVSVAVHVAFNSVQMLILLLIFV